MKAIFYPPANRTAQWYADANEYPGVDMGGVEKVLLHSTEGSGWPSYDGGAIRPTLTYFPAIRAWRQHGRLDYSARALVDPAGTVVRENRDKVCQVEIVATCDPARHKTSPKWTYIPLLTDAHLDDLAMFLAFMHVEYGVPMIAAPLWLPYPASYGPSRARMSGPEYDAFKGLLGHETASGNVHGDPGNIDAHGVCVRAQLIVNPPKPPTPPVPPAPVQEDEDDVMELRTYGGKTYAFWGLLRREILPADTAAAVKELGASRPAALWEMNLRTPLERVLEIQGDTRVDVVDIDETTTAVAADVAELALRVDKTQVMVASVRDQVTELASRIPTPPTQ